MKKRDENLNSKPNDAVLLLEFAMTERLEVGVARGMLAHGVVKKVETLNGPAFGYAFGLSRGQARQAYASVGGNCSACA